LAKLCARVGCPVFFTHSVEVFYTALQGISSQPLRQDALPVAQPTASKHWRGNTWVCI